MRQFVVKEKNGKEYRVYDFYASRASRIYHIPPRRIRKATEADKSLPELKTCPENETYRAEFWGRTR